MSENGKARVNRSALWCVVVAMAVVGLFVGWQARVVWHENQMRQQQAARLLKAILNAHQNFSVRESARPEFAPDKLDALNSFSRNRTGFILKFPEQRPAKFKYRGGRLFPIDGSSALFLTFQDGNGPVSVAAFRDPFPLPDDFGANYRGDASVTVKRDSGYTVAIIGKAPESDRTYLAEILRRVPQK